ncbi:uncharacterized protein LOC142256450 [Anomaloglossus baeobatrachus]|uniref:uncharacterized protein LOC142256450 n=1 Tax=Anomaloglossus baeobatrachus TaxID=238106 RepID=UPI003F4F6866
MMPKTNIYQESPENIAREFRDREAWGTVCYMAPEVILSEGFGRPVDWWSMGIILYEFLVGNVPFRDKDKYELYRKIVRGDILFKCFPPLPLDARNLITKLLTRNPVQRLGTGGADEIKCQPFLEDLDFENLLSQEPEYVPQRLSDVFSCLSDNDSEVYQPMGSEDKDKRREDNENREFQNFTSSSERLSKLCTSVIRTMSKEDPKTPPESSQESNTKSSEMQKESPPVSDGDDAVSSGISSFPFSEFPVLEEEKSVIILNEELNSENKEQDKKSEESPAQEEAKSAIYLSGEPKSQNEEQDNQSEESPAQEEEKSAINLIEEPKAENEQDKKSEESPAQEEAKSAIHLSGEPKSQNEEQDNQSEAEEKEKSAINLREESKPENGERGKKRRGSIFRRILSSCRRGLARAARACVCCPCFSKVT